MAAASDDDGGEPSAWRDGPRGKLSPWSLAKVWALHAVNEEYDLGLTSAAIAEKVVTIGGRHPSDESIRQWRLLFEADPDWYPGKTSPGQKTAGRKKVITAAQERAIAKTAMALKGKTMNSQCFRGRRWKTLEDILEDTLEDVGNSH